MGRCSKLRTLLLPPCIRLKNLPTEVLSYLASLEELKIIHVEKNTRLRSLHLPCLRNVKELSDLITQYLGLEELHLSGCENLTKLPENMRHLSQLQLLSVANCRALKSLAELPPSLRILDAHGCNSLERVSISSTPENCGEKLFSFSDCHMLDLGTIEEQAMRLLQNAVCEKEDVTIIYAGKKVPKWFGDNRTQHGSDTVQLSLSSHNLLGFVFCVVVQEEWYHQVDLSVRDEGGEMFRDVVFPLELKVNTEKIDFEIVVPYPHGNVLLCSRAELSKSILEKIESKRRNHRATTYNPKVFFKFHDPYSCSCEPIGESGVYPIYAS